MFQEVKQNWLGFSLHGNGGSGLGKDFADALNVNLGKPFADFGLETITKSSTSRGYLELSGKRLNSCAKP
jgi:hypothetical protein